MIHRSMLSYVYVLNGNVIVDIFSSKLVVGYMKIWDRDHMLQIGSILWTYSIERCLRQRGIVFASITHNVILMFLHKK